jgi:hypothetical protein
MKLTKDKLQILNDNILELKDSIEMEETFDKEKAVKTLEEASIVIDKFSKIIEVIDDLKNKINKKGE